jgi:hypothetical protein
MHGPNQVRLVSSTDQWLYLPDTRHSPGPTLWENSLRRRTPVSARSARPADPGRFHCNPPRMGDDPGGFRLWWRQLTGSDTPDKVHVAEAISAHGIGYAYKVHVAEAISPGPPLPCTRSSLVGLVLYREPTE